MVISTDERHVKQYLKEFYKLMRTCEEAHSVTYSSAPEQNTASLESPDNSEFVFNAFRFKFTTRAGYKRILD